MTWVPPPAKDAWQRERERARESCVITDHPTGPTRPSTQLVVSRSRESEGLYLDAEPSENIPVFFFVRDS